MRVKQPGEELLAGRTGGDRTPPGGYRGRTPLRAGDDRLPPRRRVPSPTPVFGSRVRDQTRDSADPEGAYAEGDLTRQYQEAVWAKEELERRLSRQAEELQSNAEEQRRKKQTTKKPDDLRLKPLRFDGSDDFLDYLDQFEGIAEDYEWSEHRKGVMLKSFLEGKARATVKGVRGYEAIVKQLTYRYSPESEDKSAQQLQVLKQGKEQTWEDLAEEAQHLAGKGYMRTCDQGRERLAVQAFVKAVTDDVIRGKLRDKNPKSIPGAITAVHQAESNILLEREAVKKPVKAVQETSSGHEEQMSQLVGRMDLLEKRWSAGQIGSQKTSQSSYQGAKTSRKPFACYFCAKPGHMDEAVPSEAGSSEGS